MTQPPSASTPEHSTPSHADFEMEQRLQCDYLLSLLSIDEILWLTDPAATELLASTPPLDRRAEIKAIVIALYTIQTMHGPGRVRLFEEARLEIFKKN